MFGAGQSEGKKNEAVKIKKCTSSFCFCFHVQVSDRHAMHILMATVEALANPADELVVNRTSLQQLRKNNRQKQFHDAKYELFDEVFYFNLSNNSFEYILRSFYFILLPLRNS